MTSYNAQVRWALFFLVGLPFQAVVYLIYPFLVVYHLFFRGRFGKPLTDPPPAKWTVDELIARGHQDKLRDDFFLDHTDPHAVLLHMHMWILKPELAQGGLKELLYPNGSLKRRTPDDIQLPVSGDALSTWVLAFNYFGGDKEDLRRLASHYFKNCFGLGSWAHDWKVSNRSSNGGVNYCFDAWKGINQPCLGPQYFTSAALLKSAAHHLGGWWSLVYVLHYILMGGWMFSLVPFVCVHWNQLYYVQHITLLNLTTMALLTDSFIYKQAIRQIAVKSAPSGNINPMFHCWAAAAGALNEDEILSALNILQRTKPVWPQNEPLDNDFWNRNMDNEIYSVAGGAAELLKKAKKL